MQDKYFQKVHFKQHGVALAEFKKVRLNSLVRKSYTILLFCSEMGILLLTEMIQFMQIDNLQNAKEAGSAFGFPMMMKSRYLAYDGRGNAVVHSEDDLLQAVSCKILMETFKMCLYCF